MNDNLSQYSAFWKELGANQKVSIVVSAFFVLLASVALFIFTQRPNMTLLFGSVSTKDASAIVEYLEQEGIKYEIRAGGSAIFVPKTDVYKIRMNVSSQGLIQGDGTGFEIFDRSSFGISDFIQRTNYIRAIQGELSRTITQLNGVHSARVMVVMPENRLLVVGASVETTASVFVDIGGGVLSPRAVRSIQALVANSVLGLTMANVAVIDNNGNVLSRDQGDNDMMQVGSSLVEYRQGLENYFAKKVESLLEAAVGAGNVVVRVATEVDAAQTSTVSEDFNNEGGVLREQVVNEQITSSVTNENLGGNEEGALAQNLGAAATSSRIQEENTTREQRFEIDRTVTSRVEAPGQIKRISASVFVAMQMTPAATPDGAPTPVQRSEAEMNQLRRMVANALGIVPTPENLELIALQEAVFSRPASAMLMSASSGFDMTMLLQHADQIAGGAIALILFMLFMRMLKRAKSESGPLDRLREARMEDRAEMDVMGNQNITPEILNGLIRQKPENVSINLRKWLSGESAQ